MIWVLAILGLLMTLVVILLAVPIIVYVDTAEGRYEVKVKGLVTFSVEGRWPFRPQVKVLGMTVRQKARRGKEMKVEKRIKKEKKKTSFLSRKTFRAWWFLISRALRSFQIKSLVINIDTGDVVSNARLVPWFVLLSRGPLHLQTNFQGHVFVHSEVQNRLARLVWIFFQFLIKK
jgi:hypothetical protein